MLLVEPLGTPDLEPGLFTRGNSLEPYAIECLAGATEAVGYPTDVLQQGPLTIEDIVGHVGRSGAFCVGLSVLTHTAEHSVRIAQAIKEAYPETYVVVGGQHPSLVPDYLRSPCFDYAVLGEGEATFPELVDFLSGRRFSRPEEILGIAYRDPGSGEILLAPPRPRIRDLDSLPPPKRVAAYLQQARSWNLVYPGPDQQIAVAQIGYSRGCRYRCTFCVSPPVWDGSHGITRPSESVSFRAARSVAREIRHLHETFGVNFLYFTDLTFNLDPARVRELCTALIDEGLHDGSEADPRHLERSVHWFALVKVGLDSETAMLMARAGCSKIGMGVETFDDARVRTYKKPYRGLTILERSLHAADAAGIITRCLLVMGTPDETRDTVANTIRGLRQLPIDQVRIAFLTPYPNTPIYRELAGRIATQDFALYDEEHPVLRSDHFTADELYGARQQIADQFYGSAEYRERIANKLRRFPWLRDSYKWFLNDLHARSSGKLDLRMLADGRPLPQEALI